MQRTLSADGIAIRVKSLNAVSSNTQDRRQSTTLILSTNVDQKSPETENDCHLSPDWRQMAIENTVSRVF